MTPRFLELEETIWQALKREVLKTYQREEA
jgi:hypothetical protein